MAAGRQVPDDDFEGSFGESMASAGKAGAGGTRVRNQPHDEEVELDEQSLEASVDTHASPQRQAPRMRERGDSPPVSADAGGDASGYPSDSMEIPGSQRSRPGAAHGMMGGGDDDEDDEDDSDGEDGAGPSQQPPPMASLPQSGDAPQGSGPTGAAPTPSDGYNAARYQHLNVPSEIRDLFEHITRFTPSDVELETKLKPFIPDYIPAVGELDAFLKPPRPDGQEELQGLSRVDEPGANQSDPTVLDLQLRALSKKSNLQPMVVRSIEAADKNPREIDKWIESINELHRTKPRPQVNYTKSMPDLEDLMQEWPEKFEEQLRRTPLPSADMDLSLDEFARVACAICDIPVYDKVTHSLHVLFSLYNEFRSNAHFAARLRGAPGGEGAAGEAAGQQE